MNLGIFLFNALVLGTPREVVAKSLVGRDVRVSGDVPSYGGLTGKVVGCRIFDSKTASVRVDVCLPEPAETGRYIFGSRLAVLADNLFFVDPPTKCCSPVAACGGACSAKEEAL